MNAKYKGIFGEFLAALYLRFKGFRILEKRFKTSVGEIDIIALKKDTLVFVEVKTRKNSDRCFEAIKNKQLNRIQRASQIFIQKHRKFGKYQIRYDVVLISSWSFPIHIENTSM